MDRKQRILDAASREFPGSVVIFDEADDQFLYFRIEGSVSVGLMERPAYLAFPLENYSEVKFNYVFCELCGKRSE